MDEERKRKVEQFLRGVSVCIFPVWPSIIFWLLKSALSHQNFVSSLFSSEQRSKTPKYFTVTEKRIDKKISLLVTF